MENKVKEQPSRSSKTTSKPNDEVTPQKSLPRLSKRIGKSHIEVKNGGIHGKYRIIPAGSSMGKVLVSGKGFQMKKVNTLPLSDIPFYNNENSPGQVAELVRSVVRILKNEHHAKVKIPSGKVKIIRPEKKSAAIRHIKAGHSAFARAITKIGKPGVQIEAHKGVPLFHMDPEHPGQIIREVDSVRECVVFVKGKFNSVE